MQSVTPTSGVYYIPFGTQSIKITAPTNKNIYVFGSNNTTVQGQQSTTLLAGQSVTLTLNGANYTLDTGAFTESETDILVPTFKARQIDDFGSNVQNVVLKELNNEVSAPISALDTIKKAFGKLQAQITSYIPPVTSVFGRIGAIAAVYGDYIASLIPFTPYNTITATNTQTAIEQLEDMWNPSKWYTFYTDLEGGMDSPAKVDSDRLKLGFLPTASIAPLGTSETGRVGIAVLNTTNGAICLGTSTQSSAMGDGLTLVEIAVKMPLLSVLAERFTIRVGYVNIAGGDPANGIFFRYVDSVNSGKWEIVTRSGGSETPMDSGITVVANTWYKLGITINAAGTLAYYSINGVSVGTISTNIPLSNLGSCGFSITKNLGTTARLLYGDYIFIAKKFTTPR